MKIRVGRFRVKEGETVDLRDRPTRVAPDYTTDAQ